MKIFSKAILESRVAFKIFYYLLKANDIRININTYILLIVAVKSGVSNTRCCNTRLPGTERLLPPNAESDFYTFLLAFQPTEFNQRAFCCTYPITVAVEAVPNLSRQEA